MPPWDCRRQGIESRAKGGSPIFRPRWIRRSYEWVAGFAESRNADLVLFLLAFAESSFFPIPPDVLLLALAFTRPKRSFRYALVCTVGSVLGGAFGYALGRYVLRSAVVESAAWLGLGRQFAKAGLLYNDYDAWAVFIAAFTVIPYKVFTILAGLFHLSFWKFMAASLLGRGGRFFAVAAVLFLIGPKVRPWVEKYLEWVTLAIALAVLGGFLLLGQISATPVGASPEALRDAIGDLGSGQVDVRMEANRFLLRTTHEFFAYNPTGPLEERQAAVELWIEWYGSAYPEGPPMDEATPGREKER